MERGNPLLRWVDQFVGPLLLLILAPFFALRGRRQPAEIKTVGLLKSVAIGDTILLSALVTDLKKWDPSLRVILFAGPSNFAFAKNLTGVDLVEKLPLSRPWRALQILRRHDLDVLIDADAWPRISALLTALSGARCTVGFQTPGQHRDFLYDLRVDHSNNRHELENLRRLLGRLSIPTGSGPQDFGNPWRGSTADLILFHAWPGGTLSHLKEWTAEGWAELARELLRSGSFRFAFTGGPDDQMRNQQLIDELPPDLQPLFENRASASFTETFALLARARLVVSVNTGLMHLAAAQGVPTVGLHGPTNPQRWGPVGAHTRAVLSQSPGAGHLNLGFEYPDETNRMLGLKVADVVRACQELLRGAP